MTNKDNSPVTIFWFRRDLRWHDNKGLFEALTHSERVLPIFIFDTDILDDLPQQDARVQLIHNRLSALNSKVKNIEKGIQCYFGKPEEVLREITAKYPIEAVYCNEDFEPYGIERDVKIQALLEEQNIAFQSFKDHVIFQPGEILKKDGTPYTVYTPYKNSWHQKINNENLVSYPSEVHLHQLVSCQFTIPSMADMGFSDIELDLPAINTHAAEGYEEQRDFPALNGTTLLSTYLRFGMVSIRKTTNWALKANPTLANELIWREFFIQILWHFPSNTMDSFRTEYNALRWENNEALFEAWKNGTTGYPIVDAGMRELNATGYMHNRVRMITASFLVKHLLIDYRWGESYFQEKLLDFDLALNNGNWQWVAGVGCDAAPYFRVFNPTIQQEKFDKNAEYIQKWVPEYGTAQYPAPVVEHKFARERALERYGEVRKRA